MNETAAWSAIGQGRARDAMPCVQAAAASARGQVAEHYESTVRRYAKSAIARMAVPPSLQYEDLVGEGMVALIQAVGRFDPARGKPFAAFVRPRLNGALHDFVASYRYGRSHRSARRRAGEWPTMKTFADLCIQSDFESDLGPLKRLAPAGCFAVAT